MKRSLSLLVGHVSSKSRLQRRLASACRLVEVLESRVFLSGSVLASVVHGDLRIRGDSAANAIVLDEVGLAGGQVRVSPADGTSINHQANPVILSGVTRGALIAMGAGDDSVGLSNLNIPGTVTINARGGTNTLTLNNVQVGRSLNIQNGARLSTITIADATIGRNLSITASSAQDVILRSVQVQRSTTIASGPKGAAITTIDDSTFHGATRLSSGNGADIIQLDANGDPLGQPTIFGGQVKINMGRGNDDLLLGLSGQTGNHSGFTGKVFLDGGLGHDTLSNFDTTVYSGKRFHIKGFESRTTVTDITTPTVNSTNPANDATGIALNTKIAATFSEPMNPLTIVAGNVTVSSATQASVSGTVAYVGTTMTFTPASPLAANTTFTLTIGAGAQDVDGIPLASNFVTTFTTGATSDTTAPTVSSTTPANNSAGVALNKKVAVTFSKAMDPQTITSASVILSAPGQASVAGNVAYVGATMTFTPSSQLTASTVYTVTITTAAADLAGNHLAGNFVSSFTTGATADTTAPTVISTNPANSATGVAPNKKLAATFSEAMDPQTIIAANVMVTAPGQVHVAGGLTYAGNTLTFTPSSALEANTTFTVTITTGVTDLSGNHLAHNLVWNFTTGATPDVTPPTVTSTNPVDLQANVFINKSVAATFSEAIDPTTITTADFTVTASANTLVSGTVNYDAASETATFSPSSDLASNTTFTATINGGANGAKDLAGNALANNKVWTFTTGSQAAQAPINLGSASAFAVMATASISSTGATQINGDVGLNPGSSQGIPPAQVNGTIHIDDQAIIKAQSDLLAGYNDAVSRSVTSQSLPGNMGGLTFTPGLYTNSTSVLIQGAGPANNVTLDAQGDPNAIFIFQMGSTLTTGPGAQVILAGGAKAGNIFWQVGTSATLNTTTIFKGNILAAVTITVNSGSAVEGRLLGGSNSDGSVTVNASTVTVPTA